MTHISIVIPSFNGKSILEKSLPEVIKYSARAEIVVVDDGSDDGTVAWLEQNYPKIKVVSNPINLGFPRSVNTGVKSATGEYVCLLNNDVYPRKGYLDEALKFFKDEKIFAVTFNETHSSWPQTSWLGKLHYIQGKEKTKPIYSTWASGGSCIFRRSIWNSLGGFNPIYSPGYWEDIDLGWRVWKAGFRIIWAPKAQVEHRHESTFKKLDQRWLDTIKQRNELLFTWQNISDSALVASHLSFLIRHTLSHPGYLRVVVAALGCLPQIKLNQGGTVSDKEILELVNKPAND